MTTEHDAPRDGHTPDFADLYEDSFSKGGAITPRMAYWLWVSCLYFSDAWRDARDEPAATASGMASGTGTHRSAETATNSA